MTTFYYKAPWGANHSIAKNQFKNKREVVKFIRDIDPRFKKYSYKKVEEMWNVSRG